VLGGFEGLVGFVVVQGDGGLEVFGPRAYFFLVGVVGVGEGVECVCGGGPLVA
jgi:hypothetical protein